MNKKLRKITALTALSTIVLGATPAFAETKLKEYDGEVSYAVAYKDGNVFIQGDIEEADDEGAFLYTDGKYTELDDIDSGDDVTGIIGEKYVEISDGDYYVDLNTGKVTDDGIWEDYADDAATALKKKIKKDEPDDRYDEDAYSDVADTDDNYTVEKDNGDATTGKLIAIPQNKFQEEWFITKMKAAEGCKSNQGRDFTVYTDKDGKYIDADHLLGKVSFSVNGNSVSIKNTDDDDDGYTVGVNHVRTLASDKDYIYRLVELKIYDGDTDITTGEAVTFKNDVAGTEVTTDSAIGLSGKVVQAIQKISKEQSSDDIDDAKLPKSTETYFLTDEDGDSQDIFGLSGSGDVKGFSVVDGKLVSYCVEDDTIYAQSIQLKSKAGYYYLDIDDGVDEEIEIEGDEPALDFDVDGNLWFINGGKVYKFDNKDDFDKVYKVDGSANRLSVYDKNNLIAWSDDDDDVYSMVTGSSSSTTTNDTATTTDQSVNVTKGWVQDPVTQTWTYTKEDGTKQLGWYKDTNGIWYYLDPTTGVMKTGWLQDAGKWYYLDVTGAMKTGWIFDNGSWYFLESNGAMKTGWLYNGGAWYYLKPTSGNMGHMMTGWVQAGGKWYYCNTSGAMLSNTTVDGYKLGSDGAWIK